MLPNVRFICNSRNHTNLRRLWICEGATAAFKYIPGATRPQTIPCRLIHNAAVVDSGQNSASGVRQAQNTHLPESACAHTNARWTCRRTVPIALYLSDHTNVINMIIKCTATRLRRRSHVPGVLTAEIVVGHQVLMANISHANFRL